MIPTTSWRDAYWVSINVVYYDGYEIKLYSMMMCKVGVGFTALVVLLITFVMEETMCMLSRKNSVPASVSGRRLPFQR